MPDLGPVLLSLALASITTVVLLVISVPVAYWLAYSRTRLSMIADITLTLPLVLPPTVLGFYLLLMMSPSTLFGEWLHDSLGLRLVFTFVGLIIGSIIYSLPFMVHPIRSGFASLPGSLIEASYTLGKTRWQTLWHVLIPNNIPGLVTGIVLAFAHTLGEFGVVLMIGGSIPGRTRVASVAIYEAVESLDYTTAHIYSLILIGLCLAILLPVYIMNYKRVTIPI